MDEGKIGLDEQIDRLDYIVGWREKVNAKHPALAMQKAILASLERLKELEWAAREAISDARAACGGDGCGCDAFRPHYDTPDRRWKKCGSCPMDAVAVFLPFVDESSAEGA